MIPSSGIDLGSWPDWLAASAAVSGAILVVAQLQHSVHVTAIDAARRFIEDTRTHWDNCKSAAGAKTFDPDGFRSALYAFIAQLELNTAALSEIDFPDRIESMIERTIITFINEMIESSYDPYLREIFSNSIMCPCLRDFCLQRQSRFDKLDRVMSALCISGYRYK